jgi:hypothetical protein
MFGAFRAVRDWSSTTLNTSCFTDGEEPKEADYTGEDWKCGDCGTGRDWQH